MSHIVLLQTPDGRLVHLPLPPPPPEGAIGLHTVDLDALGVLPAEVPNPSLDKFLNDMADRARAAANNQEQTAVEALARAMQGVGCAGQALRNEQTLEKDPVPSAGETLAKDKGCCETPASTTLPTPGEALWAAKEALVIADAVATILAKLPFERMKDATDVLRDGSTVILDCLDKSRKALRVVPS